MSVTEGHGGAKPSGRAYSVARHLSEGFLGE